MLKNKWLKSILLLFAFLMLTSQHRCQIENLARVVDVDDNKKTCIVGVWPAVQKESNNQKFKMVQKEADRFIENTKAQVDTEFRNRYRSFVLDKNKMPTLCKNYLWADGISAEKYRRDCMAKWAQYSKPNSCSSKQTYAIGAIIINGTAIVQVVRLNKPNRAAHKRIRTARGKDQESLAKNFGIKIKQELKTHIR